MILTFKTQINGKPTHFVEKIEASVFFSSFFTPKIHTIRKGYRFKPGDRLHMTTNGRYEKKEFFNEGIEALSKCISAPKIRIRYDDECKMIWIERKPEYFTYASSAEIETLAQNDGFDNVDDFWAFFKGGVFEGQIIHWTAFRYEKKYYLNELTCQKCNKSAAQDNHPCPYLSDYEDDSNTLCNCCDDCARDCARSV